MDKTIVWLMCRCYVWPTYAWSIDRGSEFQGRCGRCGEGARYLPWAADKREAKELFYLEYNRSIVPIK